MGCFCPLSDTVSNSIVLAKLWGKSGCSVDVQISQQNSVNIFLQIPPKQPFDLCTLNTSSFIVQPHRTLLWLISCALTTMMHLPIIRRMPNIPQFGCTCSVSFSSALIQWKLHNYRSVRFNLGVATTTLHME